MKMSSSPPKLSATPQVICHPVIEVNTPLSLFSIFLSQCILFLDVFCGVSNNLSSTLNTSSILHVSKWYVITNSSVPISPKCLLFPPSISRRHPDHQPHNVRAENRTSNLKRIKRWTVTSRCPTTRPAFKSSKARSIRVRVCAATA
jgi:hypothetical protein